MSQIHFFNPGHETAVLLGTENYTPPTNVRKMMHDLSFLPMWYADSNDYVYLQQPFAPHFASRLPNELKPLATPVSAKELKQLGDDTVALEAMPWGISPHSLSLFQKLKEKHGLNLDVPIWKDAYFQLTGRQMAARCLELVRQSLPDLPLPYPAKCCKRVSDVERYLVLQNAPFVIKAPYSSSGRGLLWLSERKLLAKDRNWVEGAISKQGYVTIERQLDKVQDLAMEFYSDGNGTVTYEGLSVFGTAERGAYSGNLLGSQAHLSEPIARMVGEETLQQIQQAVTTALSQLYGAIYKGYLGVDMIVYRTKEGNCALHPCIEINMRYTMGLVALRLSQKFLAPGTKGDFHVTYEKKAGEAYEQHRFMKKAYPLILENGKIREGYLSLSPVTPETNYRAYIVVV